MDGEIDKLHARIADLERELATLQADAQILQHRHVLLNTLLETSVAAVVIVNPRGEIIFASKRAEEILGLDLATLHRRRYDSPEWHHTDPDGGPWPDEKQPFTRIMTSGRPVFDVRHGIELSDGTRKILSINGAPIKDEQDTIRYLVFLISDITESKRLEDQVREVQKFAALDRLARGVAHDFNNILTVIGGSSESLLSLLHADHPAYEDALQIRQATDRAIGLIRQLLAFSRQQAVRPRLIDLNQVISGLHSMLTRLNGEQIELVLELAPKLHAVRADRSQLEQVILNLAVNARDAMAGSGRLTIATSNALIKSSTTRRNTGLRPGRYVSLTVSDSGPGIDPAIAAHIFEPFFTTKEPGKGTGLGLSTVHGIVSQHGGQIWFESRPGSGTSFFVYLPVGVATQPFANEQAAS